MVNMNFSEYDRLYFPSSLPCPVALRVLRQQYRRDTEVTAVSVERG